MVLVRPDDLKEAIGLPATVIVATIVSLIYWGIATLLVRFAAQYARTRR